MPYIPAPYDACQESVKMSTVTTKSLSGSTELRDITEQIRLQDLFHARIVIL